MTDQKLQAKANDYANRSIESLKEMMDALTHAQECSGEVDCETCGGCGYEVNEPGDHVDCPVCKGEGQVKCTEGADSDNPEAWHDEEAARRRIEEDPLSLEVRSDWHQPGDRGEDGCGQFRILLTTGGPAARIIGDLERGLVKTARFQFQDWFTPWTDAQTTVEQDELMLLYAQNFFYGE